MEVRERFWDKNVRLEMSFVLDLEGARFVLPCGTDQGKGSPPSPMTAPGGAIRAVPKAEVPYGGGWRPTFGGVL